MKTKASAEIKWLALGAFVLSAGIVAFAAIRKEQSEQFIKNAPLTVHEWGTFTSMQGSNGASLEGLQHEEEALPAFVHSRVPIEDAVAKLFTKGLVVPVQHVTQKLETPVLYFYTNSKQKVRVRVDFRQGLLSQWYPDARSLGLPETKAANRPLDLATVKQSFLEWEVELAPWKATAPEGIMPVKETDPWQFARVVKAASVRTVPHAGSKRARTAETERYLFYRGLGTFAMPVKIAASSGSAALVRNEGAYDLAEAFALEIKPEGARYQPLGKIAAGQTARIELGTTPLREKTLVVQELKDVVKTALVAQGLFEDEATAMVNTWSRQWFTTEGNRIVYLVPRETTDELLPLTISPAPDKIVRVLVGRLEYITPEVEAEVAAALRGLLSEDKTTRAAANARVGRLGRFLEPHIRRALATNNDEAIQKSGKQILASL